MYEVSWLEFKKNGELVSKHKEFKSETSMQKFIEKLYDKGNLYQILGTRE